MGEKETEARQLSPGGNLDPTPAQVAKQGPEKKDEEQQRYSGKHSPELMRDAEPDPPEELSDTGRQGGAMNSIRNLKA